MLTIFFGNEQPLAIIPGDPDSNQNNFSGSTQVLWEPPSIPIFLGLRLTLTQNVNKEYDYVNGMRVTVIGITDHGVRIRTDTGRQLILYPWTDEYKITYFPVRLGYSTTLQKVQGLTLPHMDGVAGCCRH